MAIERILAVKLADLGDALLIVPALRALKTAFPVARLEVLTTKVGAQALNGLPFIDKIILFDKFQFDAPGSLFNYDGLNQLKNFSLDLRSSKYSAVIFYHHFSTSWGLLKWRGLVLATGATWTAGLHVSGANFLNISVADEGFGGNGKTERDYWRELTVEFITRTGGKLDYYDPAPEIFVSDDDNQVANKLFNANFGAGSKIIAVGAGSGKYALVRRWSAGKYAALARLLLQEPGVKIALLGSQSEQEEPNEVIRQLSGYPERVVNLAGQTNPAHVVSFLKMCALFIGNDGGLAQLAGVAGVPTLVIFGPSNAVAWSPFGTQPDDTGQSRVQIVQTSQLLPCQPCLYRGHQLGSRLGCAARPCLNGISPEAVYQQAITMYQLAGK